MDKTYVPKGQLERNWVLVDANGKNLGRLATQIAKMLMGKNKPTYTPGVDGGDFVIVVNAGSIAVTAKRADEKMYHAHSGYPGGLHSIAHARPAQDPPGTGDPCGGVGYAPSQ